MADVVKEAFAVKEICRVYGISRETVYNEIRRGRLRALKLGKKTIVLKSDAEAWRDSLPPLKLAARGEAPLPRGARRQPRRLPASQPTKPPSADSKRRLLKAALAFSMGRAG